MEITLAPQIPAQDQVKGNAHGKSRSGRDTPARHENPVLDDGQQGRHEQQQDLPPGGSKAQKLTTWMSFPSLYMPVKHSRLGIRAIHSPASSF